MVSVTNHDIFTLRSTREIMEKPSKKASNYVEAHNMIWITAKGVINLKIDNCVPSIVLVVKDSTEATSF